MYQHETHLFESDKKAGDGTKVQDIKTMCLSGRTL